VPRQHSQHQYYSTTELGETKLSPQEVKALLERLAELWPGGGYDLIHRNCCHFADAFAVELGMGNIPRWVNRFARTVDRSANLPRVAHSGQVLQLAACRTFNRTLSLCVFQISALSQRPRAAVADCECMRAGLNWLRNRQKKASTKEGINN